MPTYPLSYVRLPAELGGNVVSAELGSLRGPGGYQFSYSVHKEPWSMTLWVPDRLEEIAPPEPERFSVWRGADEVIYEYNDERGTDESTRSARAHDGYHWWASDVGGPMRWPNVWHRCEGRLTRLLSEGQVAILREIVDVMPMLRD